MDAKKILVGSAGLILLAALLYLLIPANYLGNGLMQAVFAIFCIALVFLLRRIFIKAEHPSIRESTTWSGGKVLAWIGLALLVCSVLWLFGAAAIFSSSSLSSMDTDTSAKAVVIPFLGMAAVGLSLIIYRIFSRFL